jgi:CRISPR/Cas system CSM-associated protein Csm3 (group 7 of RAMP superfamily)
LLSDREERREESLDRDRPFSFERERVRVDCDRVREDDRVRDVERVRVGVRVRGDRAFTPFRERSFVRDRDGGCMRGSGARR